MSNYSSQDIVKTLLIRGRNEGQTHKTHCARQQNIRSMIFGKNFQQHLTRHVLIHKIYRKQKISICHRILITTLLNALRTTLKTITKIILLAHIPFQVSRQRLAIPFPKFQGCTWQNLFQSFKAAHGNTFSKYEAAPDKASRLHLTKPFSKSKSALRQTLDFMNIHFPTCFYHTKLLSQINSIQHRNQ